MNLLKPIGPCALWAILILAVSSLGAFAQLRQPLQLECPQNIRLQTCGTAPVPVTYPAPGFRTSCTTSPKIVCNPPSGSVFPIGSTTVTCSATDACGEKAACTFTVTVERDSTAPQINCPTDLVVNTCNSKGAVVKYPQPVISGTPDPNTTVECSPPSGSMFPPGTTTVLCAVRDGCGNVSRCTFTVTVKADTQPPQLACPANIMVETCLPGGVAVNYPRPVVNDDLDASPTLECVPPSGSVFPVGTTPVVCTAKDACGNKVMCTFTVTVIASPASCLTAEIDGDSEPQVPERGPSNGAPVRVQYRGDTIQVAFSGDHELQHATDLAGPWSTVNLPGAGHVTFDTLTTSRFFVAKPRPADSPSPWALPDAGFKANTLVDYVQTGPFPAHETFGMQLPPSPLVYRHEQDDNDPAGGEIVHPANAGGLDKNTWSQVIHLPFSFKFFGEGFTRCCVSKNGLLTFSTSVAGEPAFQVETHSWPLPRPAIPGNVIFCFYGRFSPLQSGQHVRAWMHGTAPNRQAWFIWQGHKKSINGSSHTALVLEETSNHIYMVDMHAEKPDAEEGRWLLGVQKDYYNFHQVPASPDVVMMNGSTDASDNDVYLFKPYPRYGAVRGEAHASLVAVDKLMADFLKAKNVPGATLAVSWKGRLIVNKGYGYANVEEDLPMEPHHRSPIGSCSKIFTSAAILKLTESTDAQKKVNLTDKAYTILASPEVNQGMQEGVINGTLDGAPDIGRLGQISLRHLLSHTSGLNGSADDLKAAIAYKAGNYSFVTYPDTMRWFLANKSLLSAPGEKTSYSNHGMGLLGQVVEVRTGQSYEQWVQDNLLEPAGAGSMRIIRPYWLQQTALDAKRYDQYTSGYPYVPSKYDGFMGPVSYRYSKSFHGAQGGWTGSAENLVRFICAIDGFATVPDVLAAGTIQTMKSIPYPDAEGDPYAHGWGYQEASGSDPEYWAHNGARGDGQARMVMYGDQFNVAVCISSDGPDTLRDIERQVMSVVRDAVDDSKVPVSYNLW